MATKKQTTIIDATTSKVLDAVIKTNDFALDTTERLAMKTIKLSEKSLKRSEKLVHKGFKMSAKHQNTIFNTLEMLKGKLVTFLPKSK